MKKPKRITPRIVSLYFLVLAVLFFFGMRMGDIQIINSKNYSTDGGEYKTVTVSLSASRGEILDRYGRPIAINRDGYNVVFNSAYLNKSMYNETILSLITILEQYNEEWTDILPLTLTAPFEFTDDEAAVSSLKSKLGLNHYATAQNCIDEMVSKFALKGYSDSDMRKVMGIRYSMLKLDFSLSNKFVVADDISSQLMLAISESLSSYKGIEIEVDSYRTYVDSSVAPHIVGTIGKINAQEWEELKIKGYSYSDVVGKSGVEGTFEDQLKGKDGKIQYTFDSFGNLVSEDIIVEPEQGNTVLLTIDSKLQKVSQNVLASTIEDLNSKGSEITGGSVVVTKVDTGEVLASANYPSYSLDQYYSDYSSIINSPNNPLYDRAFKGLYPPGSAFKPAVAVAGLNEGVITKDTYIRCTKVYKFYEDYRPSCMHTHGSINVVQALSKSCNYFFFDTGRVVGITKLNEYCKMFGLGEKTGVELPDTAGTLAGPEYSASIGQKWYDGLTLSAAIGQGNNAFSPLQLASYTATIANGGTRYRTTVLNSLRDAKTNEYVFVHEPEVLTQLNVSESAIDIVKEGMYSVAQEGTAQGYFSKYPIKVGGKTGTAQTSGKDNNVLILFAPYENPEISISVVVEHGESSATTGPVAKAIMDAYFFGESDEYTENAPNILIK